MIHEYLIFVLLPRDLYAWTESSGDLDELLDVQGSRSVLLSSMKKMEDESKLATSLCESPAQVVLRGSISTHFTRLGWFNPDKPGPFNSIRNVNLQISRLLASLKPIAVALYKALAAASQDHLESLKERVSKFESLCHAMNIFNRLVSSQYPSGKENEVLPRTSELALVAALDRMLGVSSLMNCKSGCDRAGLVREFFYRNCHYLFSHACRRTALLWLSSLSIFRTRLLRLRALFWNWNPVLLQSMKRLFGHQTITLCCR